MGFRTEHYHVVEHADGISINSKSQLDRWLEIPKDEWEQIIAWWHDEKWDELLVRLDHLPDFLHTIGVGDARRIAEEITGFLLRRQARGIAPDE